ncbi:MAG: hypothetical protein AAGN66_16780 [Acidobacteriota bacterium]
MAFGETFLHYPDLFPVRRSGETWGGESLWVDFVGGPYRFTGLSADQKRALVARFGPLSCDVPPTVTADVVPISIFRVGAGEFRGVELRGWHYTFDRDYGADAVRVAGLDFMGWIDFFPTTRGTFWTPLGSLPDDDAVACFQCQVENYFRLLVAYRLVALGGALLHSAGVVSELGASVFFGHSGAGKTTISRLGQADGRTVLSDDMNALCPDGEGFVVEKLPFAGDLGRTPGPRSRHRLRALCRLRKGPNDVTPLRPASAVAQLLASAPFVNADPHRLESLTDNLESLASRVGVHQLTFSLEGGFWPLLDALEPRAAVTAGP